MNRVADAIRALPRARYLLAVSGGRDSMALLDAFTRFRSDAVAAATFDHGTGPAAKKAANCSWSSRGRAVPFAVVSGRRSNAAGSGEAAWRAARWEFLTGWARELSAMVVTAHTRDDQLETVVMRVLRDPRHTSPRGLAAMYARSAVARPLLDVARADVAAYADTKRSSTLSTIPRTWIARTCETVCGSTCSPRSSVRGRDLVMR